MLKTVENRARMARAWRYNRTAVLANKRMGTAVADAKRQVSIGTARPKLPVHTCAP
jgi:hypothetical protein